MIISRTIDTATKLLLILAPLIFVSGCTTIADTSSPASQTAAQFQAEPGPDRLIRYCRRMAETKNLRIAIGICERALEASPENPEPVIILAEAYLDAERPAEAAEAYRFALSIDGNNSDAHFGLGKLYLRNARLEDARTHLEAALKNGLQDPAVYNALGVLEDQSGNHIAAQSLYQAGLTLDPENTALANNFGVSLLLSKPQEIGDNIFGHLSPQQPKSMPEATAPLKERILAQTQSPDPVYTAPAAPEAAVVATPAVPELVQTEEDTLFNFFRDSMVAGPDSLDPAITPAPVEIVVFQALPALPAQPVMKAGQDGSGETDLARALLDYDPAHSYSAPDLRVAAPAPVNQQQPTQRAIPEFDLASVKPLRKPSLQAVEHRISPENVAAARNAAPTAPSAPQILLAEIPHLPIEMPRADSGPDSDEQRAAAQVHEQTTAPQAASLLPSNLQIFETSAPNRESIGQNPIVSEDIVTDILLPSVQAPSFLQHGNGGWNEAGDSDTKTEGLALHHDGIGTHGQSDAQGDIAPRPGDPDTQPFLWPNALADHQQPAGPLPSPSGTGHRVMALLLSRDSISTA